MRIQAPFVMSAAKAAKAAIWLASAPELQTVTGKFFSKGKEKQSSKESYDVEAAQRLWEISEELTGKQVRSVAAVE